MANVHIYDVPDDKMHLALDRGAHFAMQYPDRVGIYNLCVYGNGDMVAYRTKKGRIVVRGYAQTKGPTQ